MAWAKKPRQNVDGSPATATKHSENCRRVFSHYDLSCPRCVELSQGALARKGWNTDSLKREADRVALIHAHFAKGSAHDRGLCGPVCTFGDW